jgi:hypothetical protein
MQRTPDFMTFPRDSLMREITFDSEQTLVVAIIAYFIGRWLTRNIGVLDRFRIPEAVTGGMVVAVLVAALRYRDPPPSRLPPARP